MSEPRPNRVHYIQGRTLWGSRGPALTISRDGGLNWHTLALLPAGFRDRSLMRFGLSRRLMRLGVHHILPLSERLVVFANRNVFSYDLAAGRWGKVPAALVGSRPLCPCVTPQGVVYYGEYCNNAQRKPVRIFATHDGGLSWEIACTFDNVRHVHGIFYDEYEDSLWVTTGDSDQESLILKSGDGLKTYQTICGGSQQARAVQLVFTEQYIYFGSDSPSEENYIYRIERRTGELTRLQKVGGSVFWGCRVGRWVFFSTAVEPSQVNRGQHAELWASCGGREWTLTARYKKDPLPLRLFQYGQILFPQGSNETGQLLYTPFAAGRDQQLHRMDTGELA